MPEITPDTSDPKRCISVHWSLPVQCKLPAPHRENWHETTQPKTWAQLRYRRSMGTYATEVSGDNGWEPLDIPAPQQDGSPGARLERATADLAAYRGANASWNRIVVAHIAEALASGDDDRHAHAIRLAQSLDEAGLNVDVAVDDHLDRFTDCGNRDAWTPPAVRRARRGPDTCPF